MAVVSTLLPALARRFPDSRMIVAYMIAAVVVGRLVSAQPPPNDLLVRAISRAALP